MVRDGLAIVPTCQSELSGFCLAKAAYSPG